jgi:signal transduction histidine kinase
MKKPTDKGTILIVDDVPTNLKLLMSFLSDLNFVVRVAQDGQDALEQVAYEKPDLILLDIMMPPGIDGFETCRRLKANEDSRDIPVIFMTALSETTDKIKGFEIGAVDYITKPFQQEEVLARINAHLTIKKQQELLQQQNSELEAFAHTVAHDLKNPLGIIIGFSNLVNKALVSSIDSKHYQYLVKIQKTSRKMANIIDALLLLASARSQTVEMKPLNMSQIVTNVQQRLTQMIDEYQAEIITPTSWPVAQAYAPWIEEVWVNYLSNALKYGGKPPRIELGANPDPDEEGYINFWVRDNGKGLTDEEQENLFIPFTRINQISVEGHGLGLSIVQRIIEKCGGQVRVKSKIGQGSTFYFSLVSSK